MNPREMKKLIAHYEKYLEQEVSLVLHSEEMDNHIDILLFNPSKKYPFWKLATMGASDYKMTSDKWTIADRNEYIIMVPADIDLLKKENQQWYYQKLYEIAVYSRFSGQSVTYGHCIDWKKEENSDIIAAFLELPQVLENSAVLRCRLNVFKKIAILMPVMITRSEMNQLIEIGAEEFSNYLFPENSQICHFLTERNRTDQF